MAFLIQSAREAMCSWRAFISKFPDGSLPPVFPDPSPPVFPAPSPPVFVGGGTTGTDVDLVNLEIRESIFLSNS